MDSVVRLIRDMEGRAGMQERIGRLEAADVPIGSGAGIGGAGAANRVTLWLNTTDVTSHAKLTWTSAINAGGGTGPGYGIEDGLGLDQVWLYCINSTDDGDQLGVIGKHGAGGNRYHRVCSLPTGSHAEGGGFTSFSDGSLAHWANWYTTTTATIIGIKSSQDVFQIKNGHQPSEPTSLWFTPSTAQLSIGVGLVAAATGQLDVTIGNSARVGYILKGAASQSADFFQIKTSAAATVASYSAAQVLTLVPATGAGATASSLVIASAAAADVPGITIQTLGTVGSTSANAILLFYDNTTRAGELIATFNNNTSPFQRYFGFIARKDRDGNRLPIRFFTFNSSDASTTALFIASSDQATNPGWAVFGNSTAPLARLHLIESTAGNEVFRIETVATNSDPSERVYQNRVATTNATQTTLHTFTIDATTTVMIEAQVTARRTGGTAGTAEDGAGYVIRGTYKNVAGTATLIGALDLTYTAEDVAGYDATFTLAGATVLCSVTGIASTNIVWHLTARTWQLST